MGKGTGVKKAAKKAEVQAGARVGAGGNYEGVLLEKVNEGILRAALKQRKDVVASDKMPLAELVVTGLTNFAGTEDEVICSVCGGLFDGGMDACPFCGDVEDSGGGGAAPTKESESTALAKVEPGPVEKAADDLKPSSSIQTAATLDEHIAKVHSLKSAAAVAYWDLGREIRIISELSLWKLRVDEKGEQRWKSWEAFSLGELGFSNTTSYDLMDVSKAYSKEQVAALGYKKLAITLKVPAAEQPKLLAAAEGGASRAELSAEAERIKREQQHTRARRDTGVARERTEAENEGPVRKTREERIAVATMLGKLTVTLYKKPASKKTPKEEWRPAKRFADMPFGIIEWPGGVHTTVQIHENSQGEWVMKLDTKRAE